MYIDTSHITRGGKTYTRHLLRESYRANGKVLHRTIANVSHCSAAEYRGTAVGAAPQRGAGAPGDYPGRSHVETRVVLWCGMDCVPRRSTLGDRKGAGHDRAGKLALWQVMARVIDQGSRLSAVRLAMAHAACDVLGLDTFDEDALYENLDWLAGAQAAIEDRLYASVPRPNPSTSFCMMSRVATSKARKTPWRPLAINRDGKKGKRQIVIGLLCDEDGIRSLSKYFRQYAKSQTFAVDQQGQS